MGVTIKTRGTIAAGKVVTGDLEAGVRTVGTTEIADGAVTTAKLADNAVETAKIADTAVTAAKLADDNIREAKLNGTKLSGTVVTAGVPVSVAHGLGAVPVFCFIIKGHAWVTAYDGTNVTVDAAASNTPFEVYALL